MCSNPTSTTTHRLSIALRICIVHNDRPVLGRLPAAAPFVCTSNTCHPKNKGPKKSENRNKKVQDSAPPQATGLAMLSGTHCYGREAAPNSKQKRGNVEEPPRKKTREGSKATLKSFFGARRDGRPLVPMYVNSRLQLAKGLPPSAAKI